MPPLPKRKYPKARQGKRRSHLALKPTGLSRCPQCHNARLPHTACPTCGFYRRAEAVPVDRPKTAE
ncbi:MAG: 50S ribosomal protein L32 [Dehalococcoidia bacterium]|nr:50S ribosomal protein L32 [Dehalococcoidia bacterium]